ncbi:MAG: carbohydrate-binding family 9-like protein [Verrucomicrobiota bacterium]
MRPTWHLRRSRPLWILAVLTVALAAPRLPAADRAVDPQRFPAPKRVVVPKLQGTVQMDGDLNEPVWQQAALLTPFWRNDGSGQEREATTVRLWYDDQALYLAWTCRDTDVQATFTARDSKFWEEEVAEFFVTAKDLGRYFELQWNPLGGVFDAIIKNDLNEQGLSKRFDGDWSFTAKGMTSAVRLKGTAANSNDRDEFWQVEVRVPFADLSQPTPKAGETWRANFYRFNRGHGQPAEQLAWSPTMLPGFHEPGRFGFLEFGPAPAKK